MRISAGLTNPLHSTTPTTIAWSRVNMAEGLPGVFTPLSWSFWGDSLERMMREASVDMGQASRADVPPLGSPDRMIAIFYGRTALNVDSYRKIAEATPWLSADAVERGFFGTVRPHVASSPARHRYPIVLLKTPPRALWTPRQIRRQYEQTRLWWQRSVMREANDNPVERFRDAHAQFLRVGRPHCLCSVIAATYAQLLGAILQKANKANLTMLLLGGHESVEIATTSGLWRVAHGSETLERFLFDFGYQGPLQGEMSSFPWRERPEPVRSVIQTFASMNDSADPQVVLAQRVAEREAGEQEVLASLRPAWRVLANLVFQGLRANMPCREYGKASLMMALDAARAAARDIGKDLVARHVFEDTEDIFYLTAEEVIDIPSNARDVVAYRRECRSEYESLELPESWVGEPIPVATGKAAVHVSPAQVPVGIGVSSGVAEGNARVITNLYEDEDLKPGEILVCETTDPSWAPYFLIAAGAVMEIGGAMSHGAIVARDSGIPCVVNIRSATTTIRSGDRIRINGDTGEVVRLEASAEAMP